MKKIFWILLLLVAVVSLNAQEKEKKDKKDKPGWRLGGILPTITYDTDLGFQYGALVEFFNYGNPSKYPEFLDHTYTEASHYTKGSGIFRFMYESNHLIPGVHMTSDLSYLPDKASQFFGFNGYESVYNKAWEDDKEGGELYRSRMFYRYRRDQFRFKNDFQGKISGDHFKWSAGFAFTNFNIGSVDKDKFNDGQTVYGLFERYQALGLIPADQISGGWVNTLKGGLMWDSRDFKPNPMKGIWTEAGIELAPKFMGNDWGFSRFYFIHRQYFTLVENDLSLVYRIGYQSTLSGTVPYFYQSQVITSYLTGAFNEGLGGSSTMRGVMRNRVVGDGFIMGNVELRWKPVYFRFLQQDCYIGLNAFYDFGRITKFIDMPSDLEHRFNTLYNTNGTTENFTDYFNIGGEKLHQSAGFSVMVVYGQNFVIAIDLGKALNAQDGNIGFSFGLNYLF